MPTLVKMQFPWKLETFSHFFLPFLETKWNFEHFEKKDDRHSYFISEITDSQRVG